VDNVHDAVELDGYGQGSKEDQVKDSMEPAQRLWCAMQKFHFIGGIVGDRDDWDLPSLRAEEWIDARIEFREALKAFLATSDTLDYLSNLLVTLNSEDVVSTLCQTFHCEV
jgi:hypothetical protein